MLNDRAEDARVGGGRAWAVWAAAAGVYLVALFHRTSLSVAGLAATQRFDINAAQLSTFTVLQLLVYAGMQLPVGILLDRFGPKRLLMTGLALMTLGQLGFAFVPSYPLALATRALVGVGDAMTFLSVLRVAAAWFPAARNPLLTQLTSLAGQLGAIIAAVPMVHALARFGWAATYVGAACAGLIAGVVLFAVVRDSPQPAATAPARLHLPTVLASVRTCWAQPGTRLGAWVYFTTLFCPNVLVLLWGYPYLVGGQQVGANVAATLLTLLTVAAMASAPLVGIYIGHGRGHGRRRLLLSAMMLATIAAWTLVVAWPSHAPTWALALLMLATGVSFSGALLAFDYARESNPAASLGTALALVNVAGFVSTIAMAFGFGLILDLATPGASTVYTPHAYRLAMLTPYALWALGSVQILRYVRRTRRAPA